MTYISRTKTTRSRLNIQSILLPIIVIIISLLDENVAYITTPPIIPKTSISIFNHYHRLTPYRVHKISNDDSRILHQQQQLITSKVSSSSTERSSTTSSTTTSSSRSTGTTTNKKKTIKRTVFDRTPEEGIELIREIMDTTLKSGYGRMSIQRTIQAIQNVAIISQQYIPELLEAQRNGENDKITKVLIPRIIRIFFEKMGATYVKLGQFIASSPTLFPAEYVIEFQKCLDSTEPISWNIIEPIIEKELGGKKRVSEIFSYINPKPLASASIAQVHQGILRDTGEQVILKIQKPNINNYLTIDLKILYITSKILEYIQPDIERTSLSNIIYDIQYSMLNELDFLLESKNTIEFRKFLQEQNLLKTKATTPLIYLQYTTSKLITMEYLDGVSLLDERTIEQMKGNNNNDNSNNSVDVIVTALNIWSLSILNMPFFHADIHAGNLLLLKDGRLGFIDFGIVGTISPKVLNAVTALSTTLALNDYNGMAIALCNMGATESNVDIQNFANDIERIMTKMNTVNIDVDAILAADNAAATVTMNINENEITGILIEFVNVAENNGLKLPREFGLLMKQSLYFDRYFKILAPNVDMLNDNRINTITNNNNNNNSNNKDDIIIDV